VPILRIPKSGDPRIPKSDHPEVTDLTDLTTPPSIYIYMAPPKSGKSAAQKLTIFYSEILDSVRNQHFFNAGLSSCPHTTTIPRAPDRTPPRVPTL